MAYVAEVAIRAKSNEIRVVETLTVFVVASKVKSRIPRTIASAIVAQTVLTFVSGVWERMVGVGSRCPLATVDAGPLEVMKAVRGDDGRMRPDATNT